MTILEEILEALAGVDTDVEQRFIIIDYIEKASDDPRYVPALEELAELVFKRGQIQIGLTILMELYEIKPSNSYAMKIVQRLYQYGEHDQAFYQWLEAAKKGNDDIEILLYEARLLDKLDFKPEAMDAYKRIIKANPLDPHAYKELADLLMEYGDYTEAETYYKALYEYFLDYEDLREVRMRLVQIESWKEIFNLERIIELETDERLPIETEEEYYLFANVYTTLNQYERAIDYAKKALQVDKENINYSLLLIELYSIVGQDSDLVNELSFAANSLPDYDPMILKIAQVAFDTDHLTEEIIDKLMDYYGLIDNYEDAYLVCEIVVNHYLKQNDPATALYKLRVLSDKLLDEEYLSYYFAKIFDALQNYEKAEEYYQLALDNLLPDEDLVFDYANHYQKSGQSDKALEVANHYANTIYDNDKLKQLRKELQSKDKFKVLEEYKKWEQSNGKG